MRLASQTWERHTLRRDGEVLTVEALPAVHARGVLGSLLPPVMGSMIEHQVDGTVAQRLYVSGDTLTGDHLDAIAVRHPDIDTAVVHLGGTRVLFSTVTMDAEQGVDFLRRIDPRQAVPVHYDDYRIFKSTLADFKRRVDADGSGVRLRTVARGETIQLDA